MCLVQVKKIIFVKQNFVTREKWNKMTMQKWYSGYTN